MGDRAYRYQVRPRSPPLYNPARASLPSHFDGHFAHPDFHVTPISRREVVPSPRGSSSILAGPITTTTYKVSTEPPRSSVREGSRTRRATVESNNRPVIPSIITQDSRPHHRPVVHSARPRSPVRDPYRSSQEEYYTAIPASSRHGHQHHQKRYSSSMDNADMSRLAKERENSRLRIESSRDDVAYSGSRVRPTYTVPVVAHRQGDTDDYGRDGYGYTNPRDLVQYDLSHNPAPRHHRRESFGEGRRERPSSISGYQDNVPRSSDRERGPPPSSRGFDKIPPSYERVPIRSAQNGPYDWDQAQLRSLVPVEPVQRPTSVRPFEPSRDLSREPVSREPDPHRRSSSRRPASVYHDREPRRSDREDYYESRDEDPRRRSEKPRSERYEDNVDQRGYGARPDRSDKLDRVERSERVERVEKRQDDTKDKKDHKNGSNALATGLSVAGAALGVKAFKDLTDSKDDERDEGRRRRDYDDEPRRRRDPRDDREPVDLSREAPPLRESRQTMNRDGRGSDEYLDHVTRESKESREVRELPRERRDPRDERDAREERIEARDTRERRDLRDERYERGEDSERYARPPRSDVAILSGSAMEDSASDEAISRRRRRESGAKFNPKDTMDLLALKAAMNSNDPPKPNNEPTKAIDKTPKQSTSQSSRELADVPDSLKNEESRGVRIVTPPPATAEKAPVKGILRQPREKFPEDPAPIREGVAPLKDAKKDGVPPDARWTKISRKLVNPEALEAGKERYEAREDFVIVLRVLSRDEIQGYAEVTERIRAAREEAEEREAREARRRARRERHERHKRERLERGDPSHKRSEKNRRRDNSESDTTEDEYERQTKMLESGHPVMSGALGEHDKPASNASTRGSR
ncbi:hypothetical protein B0O99DRAFT_332847 [Bisporella sp. PMI_857]|nr:hypothetical protein B0O99DRAFT_332847 [Bisporella sp. PMI_857]